MLNNNVHSSTIDGANDIKIISEYILTTKV